eukprot:scaffold647822_cov47-Prasinocladus_malaysianus.AAC.2
MQQISDERPFRQEPLPISRIKENPTPVPLQGANNTAAKSDIDVASLAESSNGTQVRQCERLGGLGCVIKRTAEGEQAKPAFRETVEAGKQCNPRKGEKGYDHRPSKAKS